MQGIASAINETSAAARVAPAQTVAGANNAYQGYQILRRNGAGLPWRASSVAVHKALRGLVIKVSSSGR